MGLDISVFTKLKIKQEELKDQMVLEDVDQVHGFRAGSYSGYNVWRNQLAILAGYESARHVWEHIDIGPFYEIINFSDCEGVICAKNSKKLHGDFLKFAEAAEKHEDPRFNDLYKEWMHAFLLASEDGCVEFH